MKKLSLLLALVMAICLSSCSKEESNESAPEISEFYMGDHDAARQVFKQGESICVEFNVEVEPDTRLDYYRFEIIDANNKSIVNDLYDEEIKNLRNAHIHTHAMVEADTPAGKYTFKITIAAENGTVTEKEIAIEVEANPGIPHITNFKLYNKKDATKTLKDFVVGETVVIEFTATAIEGNTLASYNIEIHDHPASGKVEDEQPLIPAEDITTDFEGKTTASVKVEKLITSAWTGVKGNQSFHLVVIDNEENEIELVNTIVIN